MNNTDDDFDADDDFKFGDPDAWKNGSSDDTTEEPDPEWEKRIAFHKSRRLFAVSLRGDLLIAPKGYDEDHREWLGDLCHNGYKNQLDEETVCGHIRDGNVYLYLPDYTPLMKRHMDLVRPYLPSISVLGADVSGWVYSGLKKGKPGVQWEPTVKLGQIRTMAGHVLKFGDNAT